MRQMRLMVTAALCLALSVAHANEIPVGNTGDMVSGATPYSTSAGVAAPVDTRGAITQATVSCGVASTVLLAAGVAKSYFKIKVPAAATAPVWVRWNNTPATAASPSEDIPPGGSVTWSAISSFLPTGAFNCIGTTAQTVTIEYN